MDETELRADVLATIQRWRGSPELRQQAGSQPPWLSAVDLRAYAAACAELACQLVSGTAPRTRRPPPTARFCLVTKLPQVRTAASVAAIAARAAAFGVWLHQTGPIRHASEVSRVLYPVAYQYFAQPPADDATWARLAAVFDNAAFAAIFGVPYGRALVLTGSEAMARYGLSADELTSVWEEGRRPAGRAELIRRYGRDAARLLLAGQDSCQWFRGRWPVGIHRIGPGLMAFALRHEAVGNGRPAVILNGHYPGLAGLFGPETMLVEAGLPAAGPGIAQVRRWLVGADNRPQSCLPGSVRRDVADGVLRLDSAEPADSRHNVLHCSDGLLTGMIETMALSRSADAGGELGRLLSQAGLSHDEVTAIVAADPVISAGEQHRRLTELTTGLPVAGCARLITQLVPPVFGAANGHASGATIATLTAAFTAATRIAETGSEPPSYRPLATEPLLPADLSDTLADADEAAGCELIGRGAVGVVAPAGGTGGRFGGYDVPESDVRRQKPLAAVFTVAGEPRCALDIRLANARYWGERTGARIPVAVMGAPTNYRMLQAWQAAQAGGRSVGVELYQQFGTYRIAAPGPGSPAALPPGPESARLWWVDQIVRDSNGVPSLKPPGNMGTLTCLALSGILRRWIADGVRILAIANGDDVAFRLDPRVLGIMRRRPDVDAVITALPWGFAGVATDRDGAHQVRADVSGWCLVDGRYRTSIDVADPRAPVVMLASGAAPLTGQVIESGGMLCEIAGGAGWRTAVLESTVPSPFGAASMFSANQFYLRASALADLLGVTDGADGPAQVAAFVARQPLRVERKRIQAGQAAIEALQLSQAMSSIVAELAVLPVRTLRSAAEAEYSGHAPLKTSADVPFGQRFLDDAARVGDRLAFS